MRFQRNEQEEGKEKSKSRMMADQIIRGLWKHRFLYLLFLIAVMCATSYVMYGQKSNSARMVLSLNYEEAAKGLYPNNTRFNISLIKSEEVLDRAIQKAGMEGKITAQDMANNITAWASNVNGMQLPSSTTNYKIATTYTVIYNKNEELGSRISAENMLHLIVAAYKEVFYEDYTYVEVGISPEWSEGENEEYMEIGTFFEKESQKLRRFLNTKANENGTFSSDTTGETFTSLRQKVDNFTSIDLEKYNAYVLQSGLSKNKERYISKLQYENFLKNIDYQKFTAEYENRLHTIDIYDAALTSVVLIPTLDTQNNFYMSRTKVAIDYQATAAESASDSANETLAKIKENEYAISQMDAQAGDTSAGIATAERMIESMQQKLQELLDDTKAINKEYVRYKTKNYLTVTYEQKSVSDALSVKWMMLSGAGVFCGVCLWILLSSKWFDEKDRKE